MKEIIRSIPFCKIDGHIHTHLCDGKPEMTVESIAKKAEEVGLSLIILTPHFHKKVSDASATLYDNSDAEILKKLRQETNCYDGKVKILLSAEADILNINGDVSLDWDDALDFITYTVNYHPLLPLKAVEVTYSACIEDIYKSGLYADFEKAAGGTTKVIEALYKAEINAIKKATHPVSLGHFFAAHSYAVGTYSWFNMQPHHISLMKEGASELIDVCKRADAMIDLTGIHPKDMTHDQKIAADGFFYEFQRWFISLCRQKDIVIYPGSDAHSLRSVGNVSYYNNLI